MTLTQEQLINETIGSLFNKVSFNEQIFYEDGHDQAIFQIQKTNIGYSVTTRLNSVKNGLDKEFYTGNTELHVPFLKACKAPAGMTIAQFLSL